MLLLTYCMVHTAKYSDCSFEERTKWNEIDTKTKVQIYSVLNEPPCVSWQEMHAVKISASLLILLS